MKQITNTLKDVSFPLSHHGKYLLTFVMFYIGIGLITFFLPPNQKGFPDDVWLVVVILNTIVGITGAFYEPWRKFAFTFLAIIPLLRCFGFLGAYLFQDVSLGVASGRIIAYFALFLNHLNAAKRPDYNVFINNVIAKNDETRDRNIPPDVVKKLQEMV